MKKAALTFLALAGMLLLAAPVYAQTGCTDSPENPTVVLALVGGAGALFSTLRARLRSRRSHK
jgi:XrtJ-associated TM-motif-TM protein